MQSLMTRRKASPLSLRSELRAGQDNERLDIPCPAFAFCVLRIAHPWKGDSHAQEDSSAPAQTISAEQAASFVRSGMWLDYGVALCQPDVFDKALAARRETLREREDPLLPFDEAAGGSG